jgi:hypothetical protein
LFPKTSTSLQATSAAEAHPTEKQLLIEKRALDKAKSLMYQAVYKLEKGNSGAR